MNDTREVRGLSELLQQLDQLPIRVERNVVRWALRKGISVIGAALGRVTPYKTGKLVKSIRIRSRNVQGKPKVVLNVGDARAWYAHIVERGTTRKPGGYEIRPKNARSLFIAGLARKVVRHPGIKPSNFIRDTFESKEGEAVGAFNQALQERLPRELSKFAKL